MAAATFEVNLQRCREAYPKRNSDPRRESGGSGEILVVRTRRRGRRTCAFVLILHAQQARRLMTGSCGVANLRCGGRTEETVSAAVRAMKFKKRREDGDQDGNGQQDDGARLQRLEECCERHD